MNTNRRIVQVLLYIFLLISFILQILVVYDSLFISTSTNTIAKQAFSNYLINGQFPTYAWVFILFEIIYIQIILLIVISLIHTLKFVQQSFTKIVIKRLRWIAILISFYFIYKSLPFMLYSMIMNRNTITLQFDFQYLLMGAIIMVVVEIFKYGETLQYESEHTL